MGFRILSVLAIWLSIPMSFSSAAFAKQNLCTALLMGAKPSAFRQEIAQSLRGLEPQDRAQRIVRLAVRTWAIPENKFGLDDLGFAVNSIRATAKS